MHLSMPARKRLGLVVFLLVSTALYAEDKPYTPFVAPASDEGIKAIKRFRVPDGIDTRLWAAEPLLANPVAFCFDEKGRCFVAETFRLHAGVTDNRKHMYWLEDDLACRTVADRVKMYRKHAKEKFADTYEKDHDRVKLVWDSKGAGVADQASVFADGFKNAADGLGSGVLARKGNVYFTCIPDLWLLKDTKNANRADVRESLSTGYGVHVAFLGHDSHGLRMGPDGRLYFSIGDRGLNVVAKDGIKHFVPDCGAVLRCEPDGSKLEVIHTGLRNPQELAFDNFGNLFTVDNNSDSGDQARLVQIVEGGDSGWRMTYQYGTALGNRGPWNAEKMWHLPLEGQPVWHLPPLAHISSGPSGFCFNYGATAMPAKYADCFFLCDFRGGSGGSGVWTFRVKPKGASFEPVDREQFIWSILCTDCEFGPDGGFYISDWTEGWNCTGKGRIYRFADPQLDKSAIVAETKKLIAEGFDHRSIAELAKLLGHADQRVRMEAQFALAAKGKEAIAALVAIAKNNSNLLARCHAIWGLGQIGRTHKAAGDSLFTLRKDPNATIRIQAARVLREFRAVAALREMLQDTDPHVRLEAALSISRSLPEGLPDPRLPELAFTQRAAVELLRKDAADPYLRHAGVMMLACFPPELLKHSYADESPAVRLGVVLALRRQRSPDIAQFLQDADPQVALEAARAINDAPIPQAYQFLAATLNRPQLPEFAAWRALNANFRLGGIEQALSVAKFASRSDIPVQLRLEAVQMLGTWAKPPQRDRITGIYQPFSERDGKPAVEALQNVMGSLLTGPDRLRKETVATATKLGIRDIAPALWTLLKDSQRSAEVRAEALRGLAALKDKELDLAVQIGLKAPAAPVRIAARDVLANSRPEKAVAELEAALTSGETADQQAAYATLGRLKHPRVNTIFQQKLTDLSKGMMPEPVRLDFMEAASARVAAAKKSTSADGRILDIEKRLLAYEKARSKSDLLAAWRECLQGGDADKGRDIFEYHTAASCLRCHKLNGTGGDVGPELAGIGSKQKRDYLLEALVLPDKQIAKGFDSVVLELTNGKSVTGVLKSEDDKEVKLITAEGQILSVPKSRIDERRRGKSPMPEDLHQKITKRQLRDLVEFLASLKEEKK